MVISDLQFDCVTVFLKLNPHSRHASVSLANEIQIQKAKQGILLHASVSLAESPSPAVID